MTSVNIKHRNNEKIVPLPTKKSVHNDDLVHGNWQRKYVKEAQVKELAEKKYAENGRGITFEDFMAKFGLTKPKAQRKLKHFLGTRVLFTAEDLIKEGIYLNGFKRENPQRYYSTDLKTKIIESRRNNVQKDTTVDMVSEIAIQKAHNFRELLTQLALCLLYIHKLQIWTSIPKENYDLLNLPKAGIAKVHRERIGQSHGPHNVEYHIHTNGTVMIYISCSDKPFRIADEEDILKIMMFLSRVEDRLKVLLGDNRDDVVPPVLEWILKACDVNKDIEIDNMAQLTIPDIQISLAEKAFRGYVKVIGEKAYYRMEQPCTPNEAVPTALENLRTETKLDNDSLSM